MRCRAAAIAHGGLELIARLAERCTNASTHVMTGSATASTTVCIVVINPSILADAGMPEGAVFVVTCLLSAHA